MIKHNKKIRTWKGTKNRTPIKQRVEEERFNLKKDEQKVGLNEKINKGICWIEKTFSRILKLENYGFLDKRVEF